MWAKDNKDAVVSGMHTKTIPWREGGKPESTQLIYISYILIISYNITIVNLLGFIPEFTPLLKLRLKN